MKGQAGKKGVEERGRSFNNLAWRERVRVGMVTRRGRGCSKEGRRYGEKWQGQGQVMGEG